MNPEKDVHFIAWSYMVGYAIKQVCLILGITMEEYLKHMLELIEKDKVDQAKCESSSETIQ